MRPHLQVIALVLGAALLALTLEARTPDYIQVHSLFPPILKNYWANGMQFWAFGRDTVVTDSYVQLTSMGPASQGYLWNRHSNRMDAFELNVTLHMRSRDGRWFASGVDSGFGIWYTDDPKVNYRTDDAFFGFKRQFRGIGAVLDHSNELHLFQSDGSVTLDPATMRTHRSGSCYINALGELHVTISMMLKANSLAIFYTLHTGEEPDVADFAYTVECTGVTARMQAGEYHFGVTAANSPNGQAVHSIHSIVMKPLSDSSAHEREEMMAHQARLFDGQDLGG